MPHRYHTAHALPAAARHPTFGAGESMADIHPVRRLAASPSRTPPPHLPSWAVPAALVAGLWFARRRRAAVLAGVGLGAALMAAFAQDRLEAY
jgi:MYXO-CTERM domain-containing protein